VTEDILAFAAQNAAECRKVALVTVTDTDGSSPASPGQMMAVLADGSSAGTVGGGASEHRIIRQAVEAIQNGERVFKFSFDHTEDGMICGGSMAGFGNVLGAQTGLCIFGGGHIAQSLARIASQTGFSVTVVEDREEFAASFNNARYLICKPDEYAATDPLASSEYAVICTRGHASDEDALRYCLGKHLAYIGMIGSEKKVSALMENLRAGNYSQDSLESVYAPIGLDIASAMPAEIAVSILAEILLVKNGGRPRHRSIV